jgi:diacylglycerol kinase (ATP)
MSDGPRVSVVVNPIAGPGADDRSSRAARARRVLADLGVTGDVVVTSGPGDAARLSRAARDGGADVVIAWGGDGTINEVAGPLIGGPAALGIVRSGSGDGLARTLGVAADPAIAVARILAGWGHPTLIDAGYLGDRHFLNIGGIGFDATVAAAFNAGSSRGLAAYLVTTLKTVRTYRPESYRARLGEDRFEGVRFLIAFANARQYGGGLVLAPAADPADGWLDAVTVADGSTTRQIWRMRRLAIRRDRSAEGIGRLRVQRARVEGARLVCHVDGEAFEPTGAVDVRVDPAALRVLGAEPVTRATGR